MRVENTTNIPTETIRAIIRAVRPPGISNFDVRVSNCSGRRGKGVAYHAGSAYHSRACPFVVVYVAKAEMLARDLGEWRKGGYLKYAVGSRLEVLVAIMAHELRHLWQAKVKKGRRVWGARGQFSERDADAYALQMLRKFRRGELDLTKEEP